jgi:signal transduction histidine kinase
VNGDTTSWLTLAVGSLTALVAAVLVLARTRAVPRQVTLVAAAGACGLLSVTGEVLGLAAGGTQALWVTGGLVLLPLALTLYPDDRPPPGLGWPALAPVLGTGLLALGYPDVYARTGLSGMLAYLLVGLSLWWRYEQADDDVVRRALLWLALGGGVATILSATAGFVLPGLTVLVLVVTTALFGFAMACWAVGIVAPDVSDVRTLCVSVVVHLVTGFTVVVVFGTALAAFGAAGRPVPSEPGPLGVLAAVCALGYHPTATLLRGAIDRLLFGERRAPLDAASRVGARLADDPVLALRALREALALPHAALLDGAGHTVAVTGTPTTEVLTHPLSPGRPDLGRLEVGLRPGEVTLPARDREVLTVLGPALAQLMHARALSAQLQASRAEVVAVVEDERRRLRRDLHDGLGPRLTGVAYAADAARNLLRDHPERTLELLAGLRAEAGNTIVEVRRLVDGLRPTALDQVGLVEALRQHAGTLRGPDGEPLTVVVDVEGPLPSLGAAVEVAAYRIVVEALTNAARHSVGRRCRVCLRPTATGLLVEVSDDGGPGRPWVPGVGLTSMRERAELLGGTFSASAEPGGGRVHVELPASPLPA